MRAETAVLSLSLKTVSPNSFLNVSKALLMSDTLYL